MRVQPIPQPWLNVVIEILETYDGARIEWTYEAEVDWQPFGLEQDAYDLLVTTLKQPGVLGYQPVGMRDRRDGSYVDCWAFLCTHPWATPVPLYAKIGVHNSQVYINLFSLHIDDGSETLQKAIAAYRKKSKK